MKVKVDQSLCRSHAMCWSLAPEVFETDDAGYVLAGPDDIVEVPEGADREAVKSAIASCPEGALSLLNESEESC
jgi:ferredoxin